MEGTVLGIGSFLCSSSPGVYCFSDNGGVDSSYTSLLGNQASVLNIGDDLTLSNVLRQEKKN